MTTITKAYRLLLQFSRLSRRACLGSLRRG